MYSNNTRTLEEVGQMFNVTRERIRQIEAKAIRKLRHPLKRKKIIEMTENQISGRNISVSIDYEDVLSADSFNAVMLEKE